MRISSLLAGILIVLAQALHAADPSEDLIRKPGVYPLDPKGSQISISTTSSNTLNLEVTWRGSDWMEQIRPDDSLKAEGWLVYAERPNRIWVFDGVEGGLLITHSSRNSGVTSLSRQRLLRSPRALREALPAHLRQSPKAEPSKSE